MGAVLSLRTHRAFFLFILIAKARPELQVLGAEVIL
jgi:hypothetical protein